MVMVLLHRCKFVTSPGWGIIRNAFREVVNRQEGWTAALPVDARDSSQAGVGLQGYTSGRQLQQRWRRKVKEAGAAKAQLHYILPTSVKTVFWDLLLVIGLPVPG